MTNLTYGLCLLLFVFRSEGRRDGCLFDSKDADKCQLEDFVLSSLQESESILTNSYSFVPVRHSKLGFNKINTSLLCNQLGEFFGQRVNTITNTVLNLVDLLAKGNEFQREVKTIKKELVCLTETISKLPNRKSTFSLNYQNYRQSINSKILKMGEISEKLNTNYATPSKLNATRASTCKIQLYGTDSYLYAHTSLGDDNLQRPVYVGSSSGSQANWILEPENNNGVFKLKNSRYNEYFGSYIPWPSSAGVSTLAVTSSQYHSECNSRFIWTIAQDSDGKSRIKHSSTNAYLTAPVAYPSRVAVLHKSTSAVYWKLSCTG